MYIPGRVRTCSTSLRTRIIPSSYFSLELLGISGTFWSVIHELLAIQRVNPPPRGRSKRGIFRDYGGAMRQVDDYRQIPLKYYEFRDKKIEDSSGSNRNINTYFSGTYAMQIIRRGRPFCFMLALAAAILPVRAFSAEIPTTQAMPSDTSPQGQINNLIQSLSADDAFQREDAAKKLVAMGAPARAAVLQASR